FGVLIGLLDCPGWVHGPRAGVWLGHMVRRGVDRGDSVRSGRSWSRSPRRCVERIRQSGLFGEALEASRLVGRGRGAVQSRTVRYDRLAAGRAAAVLRGGRG